LRLGEPEPRPTIRDVAGRAGVSVKTVSRVLNREDGVAEATAERVLTAIAALGFHRNDLASSLRRGHSSATLGLLIEDISNPFYSAIAQTVESLAHQRGYVLITASCEEDPERECELTDLLLRRRADGLLVVPAGADHRNVSGLVPMVFLDRPPRGVEADTVLFDNADCAQRGVEHLIAHGHRRIAWLSDRETLYTAAERLSGYRRALRTAGISIDQAVIRTGLHHAGEAEAALRDLLALPVDSRPTAVLAANNRSTVGALRALRGHRHELALVGIDEFELADVLTPAITVVRTYPERLAAVATDRVFARLDGDQQPAQRLIVPSELVVRGSGEIVPCGR
jgi:LacI family transcriptional regulator